MKARQLPVEAALGIALVMALVATDASAWGLCKCVKGYSGLAPPGYGSSLEKCSDSEEDCMKSNNCRGALHPSYVPNAKQCDPKLGKKRGPAEDHPLKRF